LKGAACVNCACTVNAAAVNTTFGSLGFWVAALDGKLHAEIMSTKILMIEIRRKILNIFSPEFASIFYTNTDGQALPFVPNNWMKNRLFPSRSLIHRSKLSPAGFLPNQKPELRKLRFCWIKFGRRRTRYFS
jgi:hypothetical protein